MRLNEIVVPAAFVTRVRRLLGTSQFASPSIAFSNAIENDPNALGICLWKPGAASVNIIVSNKVKGNEKSIKRVIAHELCHEAEYLLCWLPEFMENISAAKEAANEAALIKVRKFLKNFMAALEADSHGEIWQSYANILNAKYGKDFVTATSDESY